MRRRIGQLTLLGLAVCLAGCGHGPSAGTASGDYARELAAARRAGISTDMAALQAPLPPAAENAAPVYVALRERYSTRPLSREDQVLDDLARKRIPTDVQFAQARRALSRRADLLRLAHRAAARPRCVFTRDWTTPDPADIQFSELASIREAARLLTVESLVMAKDGRPVEAVRNERLGFRIARHGASDNTLIAFLVGMACDAITLNGLQRILYLSHGDPQTAAAVEQAIADDWRPRGLASALRTETTFQIGMLNYLRTAGPSGLSDQGSQQRGDLEGIDRAQWGAYLDSNGVFILRRMRRIIDVADGPYPQASATASSVTAGVYRKEDAPKKLVALIIFPELESSPVKRAVIRAWADVTRSGAAVLVWKAHRGTFPASLQEAMPAVPKDPFDGKPLRYRRAGSGFVVYSVGPDGTFDGGTSDRPPPGIETVFRWPVPRYYIAAKPKSP